jgi:predicted DsbA family dithiol-disulfide isomerase
MAAAREGHFWDVVRYVVDRPDSLREQDLIAFAGKLGLDENKLTETLQQHRYAPRVDADLQAGFQKGIRGSPTILIGDKRIDGVPELLRMIEYVEAELAKPPESAAPVASVASPTKR